MTTRRHLGVLLGGRSGEHEVSRISGRNVVAAVDRDRFDITEIVIDADGSWSIDGGPVSLRLRADGRAHFAGASRAWTFDVLFPVLHGTYGEDGTIQGVFEMINVPYVGSGVLASAIGMDKAVQKTLARAAGIRVVDHLTLTNAVVASDAAAARASVAADIGFPCFVKPVALGSSVGITRVDDPAQLAAALREALAYDTRAIVERAVANPREVEVSVLGNERPIASVVGEIRPRRAFYDYVAKYVDDDGAELRVPADLAADVAAEVRDTALRAYAALRCEGLARVDFLVDPIERRVYFSELNTMPGFTAISMYPKLWEVSGIAPSDLVTRLVDLAFDRWRRRNALRTTFSGGRALADKTTGVPVVQ